MGFLEKLRFNFWDGEQMVAALVEQWQPYGCHNEKQYEVSLYGFLHQHLEEVQVTKQYASGRVRADIAVGDKVLIELKNNLGTTAQYQRLVGQLMGYQDWQGSIFVVLCGQTDKNLLKQLRKQVRALETAELAGEEARLFEK